MQAEYINFYIVLKCLCACKDIGLKTAASQQIITNMICYRHRGLVITCPLLPKSLINLQNVLRSGHQRNRNYMKRPYRGPVLSVGGIMQSIGFYFKDTSSCGLPLQNATHKIGAVRISGA